MRTLEMDLNVRFGRLIKTSSWLNRNQVLANAGVEALGGEVLRVAQRAPEGLILDSPTEASRSTEEHAP